MITAFMFLVVCAPPISPTTSIKISDGYVLPSLPRFIQELPPADYAAWAEWQNKQGQNKGGNSEESFSTHNKRIITRNDSNTKVSGSAFIKNDIKLSDTKGGSYDIATSGKELGSKETTMTEIRLRHVNPNYVAGPPIVVYNPYVRSTGGVGAPDWDNLYVVMNSKTVAMSEAITQQNKLIGPEELFADLMAGFLNINRR